MMLFLLNMASALFVNVIDVQIVRWIKLYTDFIKYVQFRSHIFTATPLGAV